MPFGAEPLADGRVRFRFWAPSADAVALVVEGAPEPVPMRAYAGGWFEAVTDVACVGARYMYRLPDGRDVPDPAARWQPGGVHGWSEVIDPRAWRWTDADWRGIPWEACVLYELHVGTFTPEGTYRAAIGRLDHLVRLGVTAIELMPLAQFPGTRNWGYDGVLPFAPAAAHGRPEDLKALVDAAHARGLAVFLDVVYNHFGPEGNYLSAYACTFFTERHHTPWGAAVNFDGAESWPVREFFVQNALYWLHEFHFDGLRFDAVHAIVDDSPRHVLAELAERVRATIGGGRRVHLVLENAANQSRFLVRDSSGNAPWYDAQWNDDVHHALHVAACGECGGYYAPYAADGRHLARTLAEGFAFQGEDFPPMKGPRGEPSGHLPPTAFVSFLQNHDQIGNRAFGDRLHAHVSAARMRVARALLLLAPQVPLLFMGEEWEASTPFPFFCEFDEPLATAVRDGRRNEFADFPEFADESARERIPDPVAPETFASARLRWEELADERHRTVFEHCAALLALRHREIVPRLAGLRGHAGRASRVGETGVTARWRLGDGSMLGLAANFGDVRVGGFPPSRGRRLWTEGECDADGAWLGGDAFVATLEPARGD